ANISSLSFSTLASLASATRSSNVFGRIKFLEKSKRISLPSALLENRREKRSKRPGSSSKNFLRRMFCDSDWKWGWRSFQAWRSEASAKEAVDIVGGGRR